MRLICGFSHFETGDRLLQTVLHSSHADSAACITGTVRVIFPPRQAGAGGTRAPVVRNGAERLRCWLARRRLKRWRRRLSACLAGTNYDGWTPMRGKRRPRGRVGGGCRAHIGRTQHGWSVGLRRGGGSWTANLFTPRHNGLYLDTSLSTILVSYNKVYEAHVQVQYKVYERVLRHSTMTYNHKRGVAAFRPSARSCVRSVRKGRPT
jgi:hypothetical protein